MSPPSASAASMSAASMSASASVLEEDLRESASIGDADRLTKLLASGVNVNARHALNGWTALHWAAHRGYPTICRLLLRSGADATIKNAKGDEPGKLTERPEILGMLGEPERREPSLVTSPASATATSTSSSSATATSGGPPPHPPSSSSFIPNYLRHPPFPHGRPSATSAAAAAAASVAAKLASPSAGDDAGMSADLRATGAMSRLSLESGVNADCSTATTPSSQTRDLFQQQRQHNSNHNNSNNTKHSDDHRGHLNGGGGYVIPSVSNTNIRQQQQQQQRPSPPSSFLPPHQLYHHQQQHHLSPHQHLPYPGFNPDEIVVKVRIEGHPDPDFIEVELPRGPGLDFELLLDILSEELGVPKNLVSKVRKRPDTILRKDRDLMRLRDFDELEIVVSQTPCVNSPANGGRYVPRYGGVEARILY